MRSSRILASFALGIACLAAACAHNSPSAPVGALPGIVWGPAPAVFPAGAELAVLAGDPSGSGEFTVRLRMPDGYRIPPHTHPTDENVTVIAGAFAVGMGSAFDAAQMQTLPVGAFVTAPAGHAHYAAAHGTTVVQVTGLGPFALTYVNPADAPTTAAVQRARITRMTSIRTASTATPTLASIGAADPLTERTRAVWSAGDFGVIARSYALGAANFVTRLGIPAGARVLDVACGTGNLALPAARAGAHVYGVDIAPNLVAQARAAAEAEGLDARFDVGDAERLAYGDTSFDVVMTMFGAMFAARPALVAAELLRVCAPGGRIAMANWTPTGFIGQMFKRTSVHVSPPGDVESPLKWGDAAVVCERLAAARSVSATPRRIAFEFPVPPAGVVEQFRLWYGPTMRAFAALDPVRQAALRADLEELWSSHNLATDGTTRVESEYLEVLAER